MPTKHKMPAGIYYIGDLCYVIDCHSGMGDETSWKEVCDKLYPKGYNSGSDFGKNQLSDGRVYVIFSTAYGDGSYTTHDGKHGFFRNTCVDSGTVGCVRVEDIKNFDINKIAELGNIVKFDEDFDCWDDNGTLHFGNVIVETQDDDTDEECGDDYDY